ncbi:unnamed protein product [Thelazia callipaeda]|uniref:Vacuolar protein sorting-associated protein 52 homolog n=1 Tax=Thelazia callipaeda TaxID=103827 RepID=A0A0N5D1N4_THECL|nr:unnamed protein product [Thelazia callipaeda]
MKRMKSAQSTENDETGVVVTDMDSVDNVTVVRDYSSIGSVKSTTLQTRALPVTDPIKEGVIMESVEAAYFTDEGFDATNYELKKIMDTDLLPEDISGEMEKLKQQLQVISKRISAMIMQNSPSYSTQLKDIGEIRENLGDILSIIQDMRSKLGHAKLENENGLKIIANYINRVFLKKMLSSLEAIKTLYEVQFQIKDFIESKFSWNQISRFFFLENVSMFFNCCLSHWLKIVCSELSTKLDEALEDIEMNLDNCLASMTVLFDVDRYAVIYAAYKMLNIIEDCGMKIVGFTRATLESSARRVIIDNILPNKVEAKVEELSYEQLCEAVSVEHVVNCVRELGFVLCKVLFTYHAIILFHVDEDERSVCTHEEYENVGVIRKILVDSLYSIFKTASVKFNTLLCCQDLPLLKIDQFLDIIEMSNWFKKFGRTYFGNACLEVSVLLEKQSHQYFKRFHQERMDELRMFLENEAFALCPVPLQFTLFDLQEFSFLKGSGKCGGKFVPVLHTETDPELGESLDFQFLQPTDLNPFMKETVNDELCVTDPCISIEAIANDDVNYSDENNGYDAGGSFSRLVPVLCNTSLNLLRFIGKYIRMTHMLQSVAFESVAGIFELCSYFFLTPFQVHLFLSSDAHNIADSFLSSNLKNVMDNLKNDLFSDSLSKGAGKCKYFPCVLSQAVQLNLPPSYALRERIIGAESVNFISKQLDLIRPVIESMVSDNDSEIIEKYYTEFIQILVVIPEMRKYMYSSGISRLINYDRLVNEIATTKWDIDELQSQHSTYVDSIIKVRFFLELTKINLLISEVAEQIPVTKGIQKTFWNVLIFCIFRVLVKGYGEFGKKCSNEGRALMQLDFQQLLAKLEQFVDFMAIPHKSYVENYIKAYYLPESSMESWVQQHNEYTANQIITLLNVATHISKKARIRIISALDE